MPLQAEGAGGEPRAVRAPDRGVQGARHRLLLLQRRQRFGRHLPKVSQHRPRRWATDRLRRACRRPSTTTCRSPTCCPGFGSVAKYIATSMREAGLDVASMAKTSTKVFILEVMGRHAGWIAAAARARAAESAGDGAAHHAVPRDRVRRGGVPRARRRQRSSKSAIARWASPKACRTRTASSSPKPALQRRVRPRAARRRGAGARRAGAATSSATSTTGRSPTTCSAPRATSPRRPTSSRRTRVGKAAVELALKGMNARDADDRAHLRQAVPLEDRRRRSSPTSPTSRRRCRATSSRADGFHITPKCRDYLQPLIEGEAFPPFENGLPKYVRLKNVGRCARRPQPTSGML